MRTSMHWLSNDGHAIPDVRGRTTFISFRPHSATNVAAHLERRAAHPSRPRGHCLVAIMSTFSAIEDVMDEAASGGARGIEYVSAFQANMMVEEAGRRARSPVHKSDYEVWRHAALRFPEGARPVAQVRSGPPPLPQPPQSPPLPYTPTPPMPRTLPPATRIRESDG